MVDLLLSTVLVSGLNFTPSGFGTTLRHTIMLPRPSIASHPLNFLSFSTRSGTTSKRSATA